MPACARGLADHLTKPAAPGTAAARPRIWLHAGTAAQPALSPQPYTHKERCQTMVSDVHDPVSDLDVMRPPPDRSRKGGKGLRPARGAAPPARKRAGSGSASGAARASATAAGKSLDRAQDALDQAARTEKQLRDSLKRHRKAVSTVEDELSKRRRDLETMESQLKVAKKARKRAARKIGQAKPAASRG
jgi:hypothetical protein